MRNLPLKAEPEPVLPVHVAVIMDGNRRWARARGHPPIFGHRQGADAVTRTVEGCVELGVRCLTVYAFSSENWARPQSEVGELMNLLRFFLRRELDRLHKNGVRLRVIGERERLDEDIRAMIARAEDLTSGNQRLDLAVALNYGARAELARAARRLAREALAGELNPEDIDEAALAARLDTAGMPDPDLLIRTGGEERVSNFLLWQLAYTELVFMDVSWPDFTKDHLAEAVAEFSRRERRYGASGG